MHLDVLFPILNLDILFGQTNVNTFHYATLADCDAISINMEKFKVDLIV